MATTTEPAVQVAAPRNRLIGPMPKIGIRPAIDGRRKGVRESLESQTLEMAAGVARLLQAKLRHSNGLPVECVIPPTCIGGVAEAAQTAALFEREGVGVSLTITPCWCYGAETMDMNPTTRRRCGASTAPSGRGPSTWPRCWPPTTRRACPRSASTAATSRTGDGEIPPDVEEKLLRFARAGIAATTMRGKSYLSLGGTSMGIAGSIVDADFFEDYLGMRVEPVDMTEVVRRVEERIYDEAELERALAWVKAHCKEGRDYNGQGFERTRAQKDADWVTSVKMTLIARDLMVATSGSPPATARRPSAATPSWAASRASATGPTTSRTATSWKRSSTPPSTGTASREPFVFATENDSLNGVSMLFGHLLTQTAQIFADVRTYWSPAAVKRTTGHALEGVASAGSSTSSTRARRRSTPRAG